MMLMILFFACLFLFIHTYLLFPLTLPMFAEFFQRRHKHSAPFSEADFLPKVSLLISAYNEEAVIEKKIQNCLELDYPPELLQILIGNDGSQDRTAEIIRKYASRVTLVDAEKNQGKAAMLNQLAKNATGEVLLFCDANTLFFPNVVRKIAQPFQETRMGCVCGHLILSDQSGSALGEGESAYWDLESEIKKFEGLAGVVIGGNGAIYAIRSSLFTPLPTNRSVMDDFFVTVKVLQKGYQSTFISSAIGTEQTSKAGMGEFKRKIRIGRANFNYLQAYLPLLNPLHPLVAYFFLSHKLLRWVSPHLAILLVVSNLFLLPHHPFFQLTFVGIILLFILGGLGAFVRGNGKISSVLHSTYYFLTMNYALLRGSMQALLPERGGGWTRIERGDE